MRIDAKKAATLSDLSFYMRLHAEAEVRCSDCPPLAASFSRSKTGIPSTEASTTLDPLTGSDGVAAEATTEEDEETTVTPRLSAVIALFEEPIEGADGRGAVDDDDATTNETDAAPAVAPRSIGIEVREEEAEREGEDANLSNRFSNVGTTFG